MKITFLLKAAFVVLCITSNMSFAQTTNEVVTYFDDGTIKDSTNYFRDIPHGRQQIYFPNGNLAQEREFDEGKIVGEERFYHSNGVIRRVVPYIDGEPMGYSKEYSPEGNLIAEVGYNEGKVHGTARFYDHEGQLRYIENYEFDQKEGEKLVYDKDGNLIEKQFFERGKRVDAGADELGRDIGDEPKEGLDAFFSFLTGDGKELDPERWEEDDYP